MKNLLILITGSLLFGGCCMVTSQDCGCEPPDPEFLMDEAKEWLMPYEDGQFRIFVDDNGNLDTFVVERVQDTDWIGGEECGADSEVERVTLKSISKYGVRYSIEARMSNYIATNYTENREDFIYMEMNVRNEKIYVFNENTTAVFLDDFDWNGELIPVLKVNCEGSSNCYNYTMRSYIISKEFGLLEFVDDGAKIWRSLD